MNKETMHHHDHARGVAGKERPLWWALMLTGGFMLVEGVGGILTGSLALLSDAAHMLTDTAALVIALIAIRVGRRPADTKRTFGYYRFEILAAAFNAILLFLVALYILYEAYRRLTIPFEIQSTGMLVIAIIGLLVNLISMRLLTEKKDKSLNIKGAYLEVWSDMLGSIGVIAGALIIKATGWSWVDSLIAVAIGLWVLPRTWYLLKESINVLLEGVPKGIELQKINTAMREVVGIMDIHELHIWSLTSDKVSLTAHLVIDPQYESAKVLAATQDLLREQFGILHTTLQSEVNRCLVEKDLCNLHSTHPTHLKCYSLLTTFKITVSYQLNHYLIVYFTMQPFIIPDNRIHEMADILRLMGEPNRLNLLIACLIERKTVSELAAQLHLSMPLVSHHLRLLRALRLMRTEREGKHVFYTVEDEHVRCILKDMLVHFSAECAAKQKSKRRSK